MQEKIYRILDANLNRSSEGLRVVEDLVRFVLEDERLSKELKELRHKIREEVKSLLPNYLELLKSRDSEKDVGKKSSFIEEERQDFKQVLAANMRRTEESLRVLEEFAKVINSQVGRIFKEIRFKVYSLEKEIGEKLG